MVKHCMLQIDKASTMDMTGVTQSSRDTYKVLSYQTHPAGRLYNVFLGDDETLPSCSCEYWPLSLYLCKHFFVVMRKYPDEVQWSSLSKLYRESPFFSLDPIDEEREEEFVMESVVEVDGESVVEVDGVDTNSESAGISAVSIDVGPGVGLPK